MLRGDARQPLFQAAGCWIRGDRDGYTVNASARAVGILQCGGSTALIDRASPTSWKVTKAGQLTGSRRRSPLSFLRSAALSALKDMLKARNRRVTASLPLLGPGFRSATRLRPPPRSTKVACPLIQKCQRGLSRTFGCIFTFISTTLDPLYSSSPIAASTFIQ